MITANDLEDWSNNKEIYDCFLCRKEIKDYQNMYRIQKFTIVPTNFGIYKKDARSLYATNGTNNQQSKTKQYCLVDICESCFRNNAGSAWEFNSEEYMQQDKNLEKSKDIGKSKDINDITNTYYYSNNPAKNGISEKIKKQIDDYEEFIKDYGNKILVEDK